MEPGMETSGMNTTRLGLGHGEVSERACARVELANLPLPASQEVYSWSTFKSVDILYNYPYGNNHIIY